VALEIELFWRAWVVRSLTSRLGRLRDFNAQVSTTSWQRAPQVENAINPSSSARRTLR